MLSYLRTFGVILPIAMGARKPGSEANVLEMPNNSDAYLGVTSAWFTMTPAPYEQPMNATAIVIRINAPAAW